jgi:hypothetical protein
MNIKKIVAIIFFSTTGVAGANSAVSTDDESFLLNENCEFGKRVVEMQYGPIAARPRDRDMIKPPIIPRIPPK